MKLRQSWYYTTTYDMQDRRVSMGGVVPDTGRNIAGLRNAISFLIETRGVGIGRAHFTRRVYTHVVAMRTDSELLAWWLADLVLAQCLRWSRPLPLLVGQAFGPAFRTEGSGGRRIRPGERGFERAVCVALVQAAAEACRLASELSRRAEKLLAVGPKLRAKGAGDVILLLLNEDAVAGSLVTKNLSRFAARRLFDRLLHLGAVRELSGRTTFRLFGL